MSTNITRNANILLTQIKWRELNYDKIPIIGSQHEPSLQSQRIHFYEEKLIEFVNMGRTYRCFCSEERLEIMGKKQIAMKKLPHYDRRCLNLSTDCITQKMEAKQPYIWRFKINEHQALLFNTINHKTHTIDMQHFADFALTLQDGSFTFIFSNFVDDVLMEISHVIRGEDHLNNTALQLSMYDALALKTPMYIHESIACNNKDENLSKHDFGFKLRDLQRTSRLSFYVHEPIFDTQAPVPQPRKQTEIDAKMIVKRFERAG